MLCTDQNQYVPGMLAGHKKVQAPEGINRFEARDLALEAAGEHYRQPMLLAWMDSITGQHSPQVECCQTDKPSWVLYAANRGADMAVEVGDGDFYFLFREGAVM